jgi:hypothetical protein
MNLWIELRPDIVILLIEMVTRVLYNLESSLMDLETANTASVVIW